MAITPLYTTIETNAGDIIGPIRVLAIDRITAEKTCRAQGWPYEDTPQVHALLTYWAAKRAGATTATNYDEFMLDLADFSMSRTPDDEATEPADPTTAGSAH